MGHGRLGVNVPAAIAAFGILFTAATGNAASLLVFPGGTSTPFPRATGEPVKPIQPISPVGPVRPIGGPVRPIRPIERGPVGVIPVQPVGPEPVGPIERGPVGVIPVQPVGPEPVGPGGPIGPVGGIPVQPVGPEPIVSPIGPVGIGPVRPVGPEPVISPVPEGGTIVIPVPCSNAAPASSAGVGTLSPFRSCQNVLYGEPAVPATRTSPGAPAVPGMLTQIYQRIWMQANCAYQGIDLDPSQASSPGQCAGNSFGHPCSLVPLPFYSDSPENSTDHNGASCGNFARFTVKADHCIAPAAPAESSLTQLLASPPYNLNVQALSSMSPTALASIYQALSSSHPNLTQATASRLNNCVYMNTAYPNGQREMAWTRGGYLQAMTYFMSQVLNEMTCDHSISIMNDPSVNGCASFAQDALTQYDNTQAAAASLSAMLGSQVGIADIDFCKADWDPQPTDSHVDVGQLRQQAQHLCAARADFEEMFAQLATCDIFAKTRADFDAKIGLSAAQRNEFLITKIAQDQIRPLCGYCRNMSSYSAATSCIQQCWEKNIVPVMTHVLNGFWPLNQPNSCSTPGGAPYTFPPAGSIASPTALPPAPLPVPIQTSSARGLWGFGILVGSIDRKRRRRSKRGSRRKGRSMKTFRTLLCFGIAFILGCSQAKNLPQVSVNDPSNTCPGEPTACCGSNPPSNCPTDNPGLGALTSSMGAGAAYAGSSAAENAAASQFNSSSSGANTAKYSAASSGNMAPSQSSATAGSSPSGSSNGNVAMLNPSGAGGTGAASGGGAMGGDDLGAAGDVSTGPMALPSPDPSTDLERAPASVSYNGAVGAAAAGDSAGSGGGFNFGAFGSPGANGINGENQFGNSKEVPTMRGIDPANYFTMIGIGDSLFKKVTNRYRSTAIHWASTPVLALAGAGSAKK